MPDDTTDNENPPFTDAWSQILVDPGVRESGGEHGNEGVDFARYWAILTLLELEQVSTPDYVLLFEYLQDIAVINSAYNPTSAVLYQVKKKDPGTWSKTGLCKRETAKTNSEEVGPGEDRQPKRKQQKKKLQAASPIGRLYLCVARLSEHIATSGVFVSNAQLTLKLANGDNVPLYSKTQLSQLHPDDFKYIEAKIASELGLQKPLPRCSSVLVEQTKIAPASMRDAVQGIVSEYLRQHYPTLPNVPGQLVERLIHRFSQKSGPKPLMVSLEEIIAKKGFTRADFTAILQQVSTTRPFTTHLDQVITYLLNEGYPSRKLKQLQNAATRIQTELVRLPETKETMHWDFALAVARQTEFAEKYKDAVAYVATELSKTFADINTAVLTDTDLQALALLAILYVEEQPSAPSAQHQN